MSQKEQVLLGLSGGVDSSVALRLLQESGLEVQAAVIRFSPCHEGAVQAALATADQLGVPCHVLEAGEDFEASVVRPFCEGYCAGRTPNPCILCNPAVKFAALLQKADQLGCRYIATGHYARVGQSQDGFYRVRQAVSLPRDQSYMLYRLGQEVLSRLLLPLGGLEKPQVRQKARDLGLACADAPDSMEICFIPDGDYPAFIQGRGFAPKTGHFIAPDGRDLGPHQGVWKYTVGQRKGLGLALGRPAFVRRITPEGNVELGWAGEEFFSTVRLEGLCGPSLPAGEYQVKIRSAAQPAPCHFDGQATLTFPQPVRAPAPGQSAVLYRQGEVWGGGFIAGAET